MTRQTALERSLWAALLGALILLPNLFAVRQLHATGGYLFYANAFDEPTYLSYDGALLTRSLTHSAEYLVLACHKLGVSGGYANLVFDVVWPVVTVVVLRHIAVALGFSALESVVYPFVIVALPVVLGYSNPYYSRLYDFNYHSKGLSWITLPQAYYPPFFRTPEPQVSLAVVALASYLGIRWQSHVIALAVVPFIYPFVGIPYMFVVLGLMVHHRLGAWIDSPAARTAVAVLASYLTTAGAVFVFFRLFVKGTTLGDFLPPTHLPLVSGTGSVAIVVYLLGRSRLEPRHRLPALFLAAAPTAAANTQLIAGFLQTPHNLEQNFGVIALALVCVLALHAVSSRAWVMVAAGAAVCLLGVYSTKVFAVNSSMFQRMPPPRELLDALRREPESVLIADSDLADTFSLMAPRIHFSALARSQTLRSQDGRLGEPTTSERFENYLCVKQMLTKPGHQDAITQAALDALDRGFRYLNQDFPLIHLNRRNTFTQYFNPAKAPRQCVARPLTVFPAFVLDDEIGRPGPSQVVTTPPGQWAYASVRELPAVPAPVRVDGRVLLIRASVTVSSGCMGIGVLTPDQRAFVTQTTLSAAAAEQTAELLVEPAEKPNWVVISNCSAEGASRGIVRAVQLFPVERVTTRSIVAGVPESPRP